MTQPKIKTDIEARVQDWGDVMTGPLQIGNNVIIRSDVEGGNIRLITPSSSSKLFELDTVSNKMRIFYSDDGGTNAKYGWTFSPDDGSFYSTILKTGTLFTKNLFYEDASTLKNPNKSGIY